MRRLHPSHHPQTYQSLANLEGRLSPIPRGNAFERHRSHSSNCEEWGTKHPLWVPVFLATWSRGVAPKTRGPDNASSPATPPGSSFPGSSALSASTLGLNSDDPSGASPLRHRQLGAKKGAKRSDDRFAPFFMHLSSEDQKVHLAATVGRTWKASGRRVLYSIRSSVPMERLSSSGTPTN